MRVIVRRLPNPTPFNGHATNQLRAALLWPPKFRQKSFSCGLKTTASELLCVAEETSTEDPMIRGSLAPLRRTVAVWDLRQRGAAPAGGQDCAPKPNHPALGLLHLEAA